MGKIFDSFKKWAESRFADIVVKGTEIRINSIFDKDDTGLHLWCSPDGGKKKRKNGVFHCFKTDQKGSLVKLIRLVDNCDYHEALAILQGKPNIRDIEQRIEEFFKEEEKKEEKPKPKIQLPESTFLISSLSLGNWWRKKAQEYLAKRKIPIDGLYVCTEGCYKYRIIIPYYNKIGELIYWNGRHMGNSKLRYFGPPKTCGVGKADVVFMAGKWPSVGETIHLCEGEFNAMSLKIAELNGAACGGKNMSDIQVSLLKDFQIVLCLDNDKAGFLGTASMIAKIMSVLGDKKLEYVMPPKGQFNDWNQMLVSLSPEVLNGYILRAQKPFDSNCPLGITDLYSKLENL